MTQLVDRGTVRQLHTHANLLQNRSTSRSFRRARLDAIIVPAARRASSLAGLIQHAADLETQIVVLTSRDAKIDQVDDRIGRHRRAKGLVVDLSDYTLPGPSLTTSSGDFADANGGRASDLSLKRNFGLLLAHTMDWRNVVFLDDDISVSRSGIARLTNQLTSHEIAGKICRSFPDNSVACHARRLAGLPQDNFVSGAVLGVACDSPNLPFFPQIYNEDWFFFGEAAANGRLAQVGCANQAQYDPYKAGRARSEEFGDVLAEGLYALIASSGLSFGDVVRLAGESYWSAFIEVRRTDLRDLVGLLRVFQDREDCGDDVPSAINALLAADGLYEAGSITPNVCVGFLEGLQRDGKTWRDSYLGTTPRRDISDALKSLAATEWTSVRWPTLSYC